MGSGEWGTVISPLPIPYSPLPILFSAAYLAHSDFAARVVAFPA